MERDPLTWHKFVFELEQEAGSLQGDWMRAVELRERVGKIVSGPEFCNLAPDLQERLDALLVELTAQTRENVCTNEKCPHYNKSCKMR